MDDLRSARDADHACTSNNRARAVDDNWPTTAAGGSAAVPPGDDAQAGGVVLAPGDQFAAQQLVELGEALLDRRLFLPFQPPLFAHLLDDRHDGEHHESEQEQ